MILSQDSSRVVTRAWVVKKVEAISPEWLGFNDVGSERIPRWVSKLEDAHKFKSEEGAHLWRYHYRDEGATVEPL